MGCYETLHLVRLTASDLAPLPSADSEPVTEPTDPDAMHPDARRQMEAADRAFASRRLHQPRPDPERALHETARRQGTLLVRLAELHARRDLLARLPVDEQLARGWLALEDAWRSVFVEVDNEARLSHKTNNHG